MKCKNSVFKGINATKPKGEKYFFSSYRLVLSEYLSQRGNAYLYTGAFQQSVGTGL
jgi:hypothetical protein